MMRNYTRFIPGEEIGAVEEWSFGAVDTAALALAARAKAQLEAQDHARSEIARREGYAEGLVQGRAQALQEAQYQIETFKGTQGQEAARQFAALFDQAQTQLAEVEQSIAQGVLELACDIARQILRQELTVKSDVLAPVVREALGLLLADSKSALIRLHPDDHALIQQVVDAEFPGMALVLRADPKISRGGCLLESAGTVVDASLEKRWARAVGRLGLALKWEMPDYEP